MLTHKAAEDSRLGRNLRHLVNVVRDVTLRNIGLRVPALDRARIANTPPTAFLRVIGTLIDQGDAQNEGADRPGAMAMLNTALARGGFDGKFSVCVPDPTKGTCVTPYHDANDKNFGAGHGASPAAADVDGGKMDGFLKEAELEQGQACKDPHDPACAFKNARIDVMGFHDRRELDVRSRHVMDWV